MSPDRLVLPCSRVRASGAGRMVVLAALCAAFLAGPSAAPAADLMDDLTNLAMAPLRTANRYIVRPVNNRLIRPTANTMRYVVWGPRDAKGNTHGVPGFGGHLTPKAMATGANLPEADKPSAYAGEYYVRNATGILERSGRVANSTRKRVARTLDPW